MAAMHVVDVELLPIILISTEGEGDGKKLGGQEIF